MRLVLSIDPGVTGAYALVNADDGAFVHVADLPIIERQTLKWVNARVLYRSIIKLTDGHHTTAVVERVHAMPKNGVIAAFSQGSTLCSALAVLQLCYFEGNIELIPPQTWKRQIGLIGKAKMTDTARKATALKLGRERFPSAPLDLAKSHNRAEALLIADWFVRNRMHQQVAA